MKYFNKRVAITGGTGFIGSHAANFFIDQGATVYVLSRDLINNGVIKKDRINLVFGNAENKNDIDYFIERSQPDILIHLSAQTQALYSMEYPYETMKNNVMSTLNVLDSLKKYGKCSKVIVASSDKSYGELLSEEYTEDHNLGGIFPYDASKSMTDIIARTYKKISSLNLVVIRHCNVYGPGDMNFKRLVPGISLSILNKTDFEIRNSGKDVREYIYIDDVISSYDSVLDAMDIKDMPLAFNIGSGDRSTSLDIYKIAQKNLGAKDPILSGNSFGEIDKQVMDYSLINSITGWKPQHNIEIMIPKTINWYLDFLTNR